MTRCVRWGFMACCTLVACGHPHVVLVKPAATPRAQAKEYRSLRPLDASRKVVVMEYVHYGVVEQNLWTKVSLADGREVHHPEDLLSVVDDDSRTARAARAAATTSTWGWGLIATCAASGAAFLALALASPDLGDAGTPVGLFLGLTPFATGILGAYLFSLESDYSEEAFATYDQSLREALNICGVGDDVETCSP